MEDLTKSARFYLKAVDMYTLSRVDPNSPRLREYIENDPELKEFNEFLKRTNVQSDRPYTPRQIKDVPRLHYRGTNGTFQGDKETQI